MFVPENYDPAQKYPLVLALHGSGERGVDNIRHIQMHRLATSWADPANQAKYPTFVVAPQTPSNWAGEVLGTVNDILDSLASEFSIDVNRFYITGLSLGGFGTWSMLMAYPDKFAAAIPMSGGGNPSGVEEIKHIPTWVFHGEADAIVPVSASLDMVAAYEAAGQTFVYTHCKKGDCTGLPDNTISIQVARHANYFYTGYKNRGHVIWAESYDYPFLFPWVFDKYKIIPGAITLTNLNNHRTLSGGETITWDAVDSEGAVEIWYSPDAGESWQLISQSQPNTGTFLWNTENAEDCSFCVLNIFLKNEEGFIYSHDESRQFTINNTINGAPFVRILNEELKRGAVISQNTIDLDLLIGDAETEPLTVTFLYSVDNGKKFAQFESYITSTDTLSQAKTIDLAALPNSDNAVIKVAVSDGFVTSHTSTPNFVKQTNRSADFKANHIVGSSGGAVIVNVISPLQLTGNLYRITFDNSLASEKSYNVLNVDTGENVVLNAMALDGATEGSLFDGVRLLVKDVEPAQIDLENTGWNVGETSWGFSIFVPTLRVGSETVEGFAHPADYKITISDQVVDTSSTLFGVPAIPMKFKVWNTTENKKSEVLFIELDNDQSISPFENIFILEQNEQDELRITWQVQFTTSSSDSMPIPPQPGDEFVFGTIKPLSSADIFEFTGRIPTSVSSTDSDILPKQLTLYPNYPNPFNPTTTISYYLPKKMKVRIAIYNVLGQEVTKLIDDTQATGLKKVVWDGKTNHGISVNSGVYFYRILADKTRKTGKVLLLR